MKRSLSPWMLLALAGVLTAAVLPRLWRPAQAEAQPQAPAEEDRAADREAIRKAGASFVDAFEKGDARALAAHWTAQGEYTADDGVTLRGREAIEKAYAEYFAGHKDIHAEADVESLRFLSKDTAVEEGHFKVQRDRTERLTSRYTALMVREDGKWLMAVVREWPSEGLSLRDLDWLVGSWTAKRDDVEVHTHYEWDEGRSFPRARHTIKGKDRTLTGTQMIGKDPSTGLLRSWTFEAGGGFGEAVWSRDGKKWVLEATGVTPDGRELTATNILTPLDADSFTWQSISRTLDDEELPEIPPIKVTRVKSGE